MVDTQKSVAELLAAMPTSVPEAISAQDIRNVVVSAIGVGGQIWIPPFAIVGQTLVANVKETIELWTDDESYGVVASAAGDDLTILVDGRYELDLSGSFDSSGINLELTIRIEKNGSPTDIADRIGIENEIVGGVIVKGPSLELSTGDVITATMESDKNTDITILAGVLKAQRIG